MVEIRKEMLSYLKLDWLPKVLVKLKPLILAIPFQQSIVKTRSVLLWHYLRILIWNALDRCSDSLFKLLAFWRKVYMTQTKGFEIEGKEHTISKLKKSVTAQASFLTMV